MPYYEGMQSILNASLGEYHPRGFRLVEKDDHTAILYHNDDKVATFSIDSLTLLALHKACREYEASDYHRGI